jgi:GNAT superfamily N-acetyltransferase
LSEIYRIRAFRKDDSKNVFYFLYDILANEFNIKLDFETLDSDLLDIENHYCKDEDSCFWIVELKDNNQIIGTVAIRRLKESVYTDTNNYAELKRMFLAKQFRGKGIGQQMLETALNFAKKAGYSKVLLYTSKDLIDSRKLYIKNGFVDIEPYNNDHRADVFMIRKL